MSGIFDRVMRASVTVAGRMQPRKALRQADDTLYAAPTSRETVQALKSTGERLVASGVAVNGSTVLGWRRSAHRIGVTVEGADLLALGPGMLTSVGSDDAGHAQAVVEAIRAGAGAAVWAHPAALLALAASGRLPEGVVKELADRSGRIGWPADEADVIVHPGLGVLARGADLSDAAARLEAAERLSEIERRIER